jgi:hypothetical protein
MVGILLLFERGVGLGCYLHLRNLLHEYSLNFRNRTTIEQSG